MTVDLTTIGSLTGLVAFLGAAVVFLRGSRDKGTIATLQASNAALAERVRILDEGQKRAEIEAKRYGERIAALEAENATLRQQRPSADVLADLALALDLHDTETRAMLAQLAGKGPTP